MQVVEEENDSKTTGKRRHDAENYDQKVRLLFHFSLISTKTLIHFFFLETCKA